MKIQVMTLSYLARTVLLSFVFSILILKAYAQADKETVTICWDASLSMKDRDLERELLFLSEYLKGHSNTEIQIVAFSDRIIKSEKVFLVDANIAPVLNILKDIRHDGTTDFRLLNGIAGEGTNLLFTDGLNPLQLPPISFKGEVLVVNANKKRNEDYLEPLISVNGGSYFDLLPEDLVREDSKEAKPGRIFQNNIPVSGVKVSVKGSDTSVVSDDQGKFYIEAEEGDVLQFDYEGIEPLEKRLAEDRSLDIWLDDAAVKLDAVTISEQRKKTIGNVNTPYGIRKRESLGFSAKVIESSDFMQGAISMGQAIQSRVSGIRMERSAAGFPDIGRAVLRPTPSLKGVNRYALVVLDGVPLQVPNDINNTNSLITQTETIDPSTIAEVVIIPNASASTRFGWLGGGGVILLTSKSQAAADSKAAMDRLLRKDNIFNDKWVPPIPKSMPNYIEALQGKGKGEHLYNAYLTQRDLHGTTPIFYTDVSDFVRPFSPEMADRVLFNILEEYEEDPTAIQVLSYKLQEVGHHNWGEVIQRKIIQLDRHSAQPYADLAVHFRDIGEYQQALEILLGMLKGDAFPEADFSEIQDWADAELRNLIYHHKDRLDLSEVPERFMEPLQLDARIVLEWSNEDAEFTVQFVDPNKRFYEWEHTQEASPQQIRKEIATGTRTHEFEIAGDMTGEWMINITYHGNRYPGNDMSTHLRYTTYYNYGRPDQKKEQRLIRLFEVDKKFNIGRIMVK